MMFKLQLAKQHKRRLAEFVQTRCLLLYMRSFKGVFIIINQSILIILQRNGFFASVRLHGG